MFVQEGLGSKQQRALLGKPKIAAICRCKIFRIIGGWGESSFPSPCLFLPFSLVWDFKTRKRFCLIVPTLSFGMQFSLVALFNGNSEP